MSNKRPDPVDHTVGQSIRAHRLMAGMSQAELAEKLGVSFQQVQKYEKGVNRVGAGRLQRIAKIFNVHIGKFFDPEADSPPAKAANHQVPVRFVSDRNALRLMTAYSEIPDRNVRQVLTDLAEVVAQSGHRQSRAKKRA